MTAPGTRRLKLQHDELVSSSALNLELRHCPTVLVQSSSTTTSIIISLVGASELSVKVWFEVLFRRNLNPLQC
jgi:hypothetical protein